MINFKINSIQSKFIQNLTKLKIFFDFPSETRTFFKSKLDITKKY
jgi:hypothetical protein